MTMDATKPPLMRKFSSQFPAAEPDTQPLWGIKVAEVAPCAGCFEPTRFVDTAFIETDPVTGEEKKLHFCSEDCIGRWLDLIEKTLMARCAR